MRVAHVTDCYLPRLGGIEMQVNDLVERQRASGQDTHVLTQTPAATDPAGGVEPDPAWVHRVSVGLDQKALRPIAAGLAASELLRPGSFDVVHVHASLISPFSMLAARAASRAGLPTLVTVHSLWARTGPVPDMAWGLVGHQDWPVVWSAVSRTAARQVRDTLGRSAAVAVLPNGIDAGSWLVEPAPRPKGTVTIVSVMRLTRRKRPMPLLHMLRRLRDRVPASIGLRAVIVGDGPLRERMDGYLRSHDMDWVCMPGRLERADIRHVFSGSDLYVAPARLESFGIAALEARSAGLPVVASRHGGVGDFIADGREGFLTATDDEMVHALTALVDDRRTREQIARHNREVLPQVGWPTVLERAHVLYAAAISRAAEEAARRASRTARVGLLRRVG